MAKLIFGNNAQSTITGELQPGGNAFAVAPGTGSAFPQPNAANAEYFVGTLVDIGTGLINEIVNVTQRVGDNMTVDRGQEGTTAKLWPANSAFASLWTAGQAGFMLQKGEEQGGQSTYGQDESGSPNTYLVHLTPALTVNTPGQTLRFKSASNNTGASVINFGTGNAPLLNAQGQPLSGGEIRTGMVYEVYWNGAGYNMALGAVVPTLTGQIVAFAGGAVPSGYLACTGQLVSKDVYGALFAILGTVYGGDGLPNFGIPDLRGRVPAGLDGGQNRLTGATIDKLANGTAGNGSNVLGGNGGAQLTSMAWNGTTNDNTPNTNVFAEGGGGPASVNPHKHDFGTSAQNVLRVQPTLMVLYMIKT
jgi:microcystin-dependent protein